MRKNSSYFTPFSRINMSNHNHNNNGSNHLSTNMARSPKIMNQCVNNNNKPFFSTSASLKQNPITSEFISRIPKTDLHVHLDGSVRIPTLVDLAKETQAVSLPSHDTEELKRMVFKEKFSDLVEYLECFGYTSPVLCTYKALERASYEFAMDNFHENVRYVEVRFAPQLHADPQRSFDLEDVMRAVCDGMDRAKKEANQILKENGNLARDEPHFEFSVIACAMRFFTPHMSRYYHQFCGVHKYTDKKRLHDLASQALVSSVVKLRKEGLPIVAIDLAGAESGNPASVHRKAFTKAKQNLLNITAHAGEAFGPESIFQSLTELHVDRLGHGFHLFSHDRIQDREIEDSQDYVDQLKKYICDRRITLEVCMSSNLQTMPELESSIKNHRLRKMIDENVSLTICTDNRLVTHTSVTKELNLAVEHFDLNASELEKIVITGFKKSFFPHAHSEKVDYIQKAAKMYSNVAKEMGIIQ
eukprot:gb/GECH01000619.1/.p1 GENE.gb/GECH01000619.1/~~gb/GECH01000619.1/.p1  ORF type:complete len:472 (+),score=126.95 gb/GECH01000619.1/:1-1416(+)